MVISYAYTRMVAMYHTRTYDTHMEKEYLNELMVEDLQYREREWDRVHKDEKVK